ncbi:MAG TPA: deoxyribodipyrimidine photo-lyase [Candidatus Omnitrophota bacterium]|nr:deoxyribodipyrimidine photo-lyase [Candidatus Omnitrophota bacterium]HSA30948.1 deoxyribodipyrimidine photo-lyase [Candidatus Omnitrophota bacterium]
MVNAKRIKSFHDIPPSEGPVVYWMSRDQRLNDNWALLYAQDKALALRQPLEVVFVLEPSFLGATWRQYYFMLEGLKELELSLQAKNISFQLILGGTAGLRDFLCKRKAGFLITDFDPLRFKQQRLKTVLNSVKIFTHCVDAHNIVPCWEASEKLEFGAYTIRPKIHRKLDQFLEKFPRIKKHPFGKAGKPVDWKKAENSLTIDRSVTPIKNFPPGESSALKILNAFLSKRLPAYHDSRNDPCLDGQSGLSPYLHFGQISAQRVAFEAQASDARQASKDAFLEELIVRRELSDNFCFYNPNYDHVEGFPAWAKKTLEEHRRDRREFVYSPDQFEQAQTHDPLWNACQTEMLKSGKMHGYMRMYWAKKILEWSSSPETALSIAIDLNDRYELDGRDPNGYAGIAWAIGGVHDRAWGERAVFGKIRYMNDNGCRRKFDTAAYIAQNL